MELGENVVSKLNTEPSSEPHAEPNPEPFFFSPETVYCMFVTNRLGYVAGKGCW